MTHGKEGLMLTQKERLWATITGHIDLEKSYSDEQGQGLAEYAVTFLMVSIPVTGALIFYGTQLADLYTTIANAFSPGGSALFP